MYMQSQQMNEIFFLSTLHCMKELHYDVKALFIQVSSRVTLKIEMSFLPLQKNDFFADKLLRCVLAFFGWQVSVNHQLAFLKRVWGKEKISPSSWKKNCGKRRVYSINYYYHSAVFHLNIPLKALLILISQFVAWMKYFTCIFPLPFTRCC